MTSEPEWQSLTGALSDIDLAADDRFGDAQRRAANDTELAALLENVLKTRTCEEWFLMLDGAGVPVEIADESFGREVFGDPVMRDLGLIIEHQHPVLGRFEQFGTTIDFSATPSAPHLPPPIIGQHTRDILREHGFDDDWHGTAPRTAAAHRELSILIAGLAAAARIDADTIS